MNEPALVFEISPLAGPGPSGYRWNGGWAARVDDWKSSWRSSAARKDGGRREKFSIYGFMECLVPPIARLSWVEVKTARWRRSPFGAALVRRDKRQYTRRFRPQATGIAG
jgi:hypothetical protein